MRIGPYELSSPVVLAPMAGVTDRPFRQIARRFGAGLAASEMITSDVRLWTTKKTQRRMDHVGEPEPRVVQLAGADPEALAEAARRNIDLGAQIIDINMGCPAKKVCNRLCGSALLTDETLVGKYSFEAVVAASSVPVTLKTRTGWSRDLRNGVRIAQLAESCGVAALAVHGRTREDFYDGAAEYDTIREIRSRVSIPLFANGDIDSPEKARSVLDFTGASGVMLGRAHMARRGFSVMSIIFCLTEKLRPHFHSEKCVIPSSRISNPSTLFTAKRLDFESHANTSVGISKSCRMRPMSIGS